MTQIRDLFTNFTEMPLKAVCRNDFSIGSEGQRETNRQWCLISDPIAFVSEAFKGFLWKQMLFVSSTLEAWRSSLLAFRAPLKAFNQVPYLNKVVMLILKRVGIVLAESSKVVLY